MGRRRRCSEEHEDGDDGDAQVGQLGDGGDHLAHVPAQVAALEVAWPSGHTDRLANLAVNQFLLIEEGKGVVSRSGPSQSSP